MRKALDKIYQIRRLRNEMRLAARASGNKENIRRAAHMKMLASSAQTIPLWVGRDGEEPPGKQTYLTTSFQLREVALPNFDRKLKANLKGTDH